MIYNQNIIRVKINRQIIRDNIAGVKAKSKKIIAVLKGNAYGCGLLEMAELCIENGIDFAAVSYFAEAKTLSEKFGDKLKILVLLPIFDTDELKYAVEHDIRLTVTHEKQLDTIGDIAKAAGRKARVHLKADCGLGRLGIPATGDTILDMLDKNFKLGDRSDYYIEGLYTHISRAGADSTWRELNTLRALRSNIKNYNSSTMCHALSSAQLGDEYKDFRYDAVRVGSALFAQNNPLQAFTHIIDVKTIQKGSAIGYGQDFTLNKTSNVGFIPVGYSLGLGLEPVSRYYDMKGIARVFRSILNKSQNKDYQGSVTINNKRYPIVGRVGMNISAVLLGDDDIPVGTEVQLSMRQAALPDSVEREYE